MEYAATTVFEGVGGEVYFFSVSAHNGHTTSLELQDDQDNWNVLADDNGTTTHTAFHSGSLRMPHNGSFRLVITGGTGNISFQFSGHNKRLTN
jgi:hypothetical protein